MEKNDLISRAALLACPVRVKGDLYLSSAKSLHVEAIPVTAIENASAVDAASVVHGRWVHLYGDEWRCSVCDNVISTEGSWDKPTYKHCHECGAKMDGGTNS